MWYDMRGMRAIFYIGVMSFCIGLGLYILESKIPAMILICVGVAGVIIGFKGLIFNLKVSAKKK